MKQIHGLISLCLCESSYFHNNLFNSYRICTSASILILVLTLSRRTCGKLELLPLIKLLVEEELLLDTVCTVPPSWSDDLTRLVDSVTGMASSLLPCFASSSTTRTCRGVCLLSSSSGGGEERGGGGERDDCGLWSSPHGVLKGINDTLSCT